jgi:lysozyme family protein
MESILSIALNYLHDAEGRYVNHPADRGGETYRGVARNKNPDWEGWSIIDQHRSHPDFPAVLETIVPLQRAVENLYRARYWNMCRCDDLPADIAVMIFDAAVNHGPFRASMLLQQTLHIKMDGIIGDISITSVEKYLNKHGTDALIVEFLGYRLEFFHYIVRGDSSQAEFLRGWFNRVLRLQQFILGM